MSHNTVTVTARVDAEIKDRFVKMAKSLGRSPSDVMNHIIAEWANNPTEKAVFDLLSRGPETASLLVLHKANLVAFNSAASSGKMSEATIKAWGAFMHSLASDLSTEIRRMQEEAKEEVKASKTTV